MKIERQGIKIEIEDREIIKELQLKLMEDINKKSQNVVESIDKKRLLDEAIINLYNIIVF